MVTMSAARAANRAKSRQDREPLAGLAMVGCSAVSLTRRLSRVGIRLVMRLSRKDNRIWDETRAPRMSRDARFAAVALEFEPTCRARLGTALSGSRGRCGR